MQPVCELTTAREELRQLRQMQGTLGAELARHAAELKSAGSLPPEDLLDQLVAFRERMVKLTDSLPAAGTLQSPELLTDGHVSLDAIQTAIESHETGLRTSQVIQQVLSLVHVDDPSFAALAACRAHAASIQSSLAAGTDLAVDAEIQSLAAGTHPCNDLVKLVSPEIELPDDEWNSCQDRVSAAWGRSLATAVVRGKIRMSVEQPGINFVEPVALQPLPEQPAAAVSPTIEAPVALPSDVCEPVTDDDATDPKLTVDADIAQPATTAPHKPDLYDAFNIHDEHPVATSSDVEPDAPAGTTFPTFTLLDQTAARPTNESTADSIQEPTSAAHAGGDPLEFNDLDHMAKPEPEPALSVFESGQDSIFETIGKPAGEKSPGPRSRSLDIKLLSEDPYHWTRSQPIRAARIPTALTASGNVGILAHRALQSDAANRRTLVSQVILQLLWDDRPALAHHLTRSAEVHTQRDQNLLPAWAMHALTLGRHLCYAKGEISRQIEEDLRQFKPELLGASSPEWNEGTGFFLRAAALIPALLTSSPSAALILRSFRITPGLSHLYNYCSRILNYGQQLQGQAADLFTPDCDVSKWGEEMLTLQQSVENWLPDTMKKHSAPTRTSLLFLHAHWTLTASPTLRHPAAARLWSKWQEVFRIVHRLLKPIRNAQETERNWVKSEIDRLTQNMRLESAASDVNAGTTVGGIEFPHEAMLTVIREAIDFASRWLRLCASKPAQGRTLASRDAESLRDEILDRTDGVIAELAAYSQTHELPRTKAAIACLCRTIEHLRTIFSPHSTLALRENDPRHVVSAELLKIPNLRLNEQWLPTVDAATLETEVLSHLTHDQRDWRQAFEMHSAQHDHLATGRILELNVWRNEQERVALSERREQEISLCRNMLNGELEALEQQLADVLKQNLLSDQIRVTLEQRLERVRLMAPKIVDFADLQREVLGLRLSIDQRVREALHAAKPKPTVRGRTQADSLPPPAASPNAEGWAWDVFSDS